ncbi:MAG TPA: hypothetical protein VFV99_03840 [Kofleriaceae bacterium]|nr:hypothetical protein [Kofleriaceae bacterium]
MTTIVDIVNFNADASCLSSGAWLQALAGGEQSAVCSWLRLYVELRKKVMLGFTGATVADMRAFNPEAIDLVNAHPDIFESIARPFSHDISLLRSREGFLINLDLGWRYLQREFNRVHPLYLPPEFMLTNEQVSLLVERGFSAVTVNAARFSAELQQRIPREPYVLKGIAGAQLRCLPVRGALTQAYLDSIHELDAAPWANVLRDNGVPLLGSWRDGESPFLIPDGVARERAWLATEPPLERAHLSDLAVEYRPHEELSAEAYHSYPVHSFTAWMKEFRMLGYVSRLQQLEQHVSSFDATELALWLCAINSDVLSAVEKASPTVNLKKARGETATFPFVIYRSERGLEGEEYLVLLEGLRRAGSARDYIDRFLASGQPHAKKLAARITAIRGSLRGV